MKTFTPRKPGVAAYVLSILMANIMMVCLIGFLVAVTVPGFLRAREVSRRNSCQENLVKLESALQQYQLENGFRTMAKAATVENLGTLAQKWPGDGSWEGVLIGEELYLRRAPECPSGGCYSITPGGKHLTACTMSVRADVAQDFWHTYPE